MVVDEWSYAIWYLTSGKFTIHGETILPGTLYRMWNLIRYFGIPFDSYFVNLYLTITLRTVNTEAKELAELLYSIPVANTKKIDIFTTYGKDRTYGSDADRLYNNKPQQRPLSYPYNSYSLIDIPMPGDFVWCRVMLIDTPPPYYCLIGRVTPNVVIASYGDKPITFHLHHDGFRYQAGTYRISGLIPRVGVLLFLRKPPVVDE